MNKYQEALDRVIECYEELESRVGNDPNKVKEFNSIKTLQELVDKAKKSIKPIKTTKHSWCKDDNGDIDIFGYSEGYHNGPMCEICGYNFCHHCYPDGYNNEDCNEHYICKCGQHLKGKEKRCPNCYNLLDWSEEDEDLHNSSEK